MIGASTHGVVQHPRERHLGAGDAALLGDLGDGLDDVPVGVPVERLADLVGLLPAGRVVPVAGEPAARERAPRDGADALVAAQREHLPLLLAVEQVVVVLHRDEAAPAVDVLQVQRLRELPRPHRGRPDVAGLARLHDVVQRLERLLDRRAVVPAVNLVEVHVVHAEAPQRGVDPGHDRLARETAAVRALAHRHEDLGGDDDLVAVGHLPQRAAGDLLARAVGVGVRGVEEVDPGVEGLAEEGFRRVLVEGPRVGAAVGDAVAHAPQADPRHVDTGHAELRELHAASLPHEPPIDSHVLAGIDGSPPALDSTASAARDIAVPDSVEPPKNRPERSYAT